MKSTETVVEIDGFAYTLDFTGFEHPMNARLADYPRVSFQPWRFGEHLQALSVCLTVTADGLDLNETAFSRHILLINQIPSEWHDAYAPLALWWASGGGAQPVALADGRYQLTNIQARLRPWCYAERLAALAKCQQTASGGAQFDVIAYLLAMLRHSLVELQPPQALEALDSAAGTALLAAVIALNIHGASPAFSALLNAPHAAANLLKLCRALGWTPSQVLAAPAPEMDLMLALIERVDNASPSSPATAAAQGMASHPDAVVIRIEDD